MRPSVVAVGQAFKGSLNAAQVAWALGAGIEAAGGSARVIVGSDGGDGLLDAVRPPQSTTHTVSGPLGTPVQAPIGWIDAVTAVVESRLACGVALLPYPQRNPERTTTRGVGELVTAAVAAGARRVIVGLGGSATMDGGLGAARAWGWRAWNAAGHELPEGGGALIGLERLEPGQAPGAGIVALADVTNSLLGREGAAVYARQKGASAGARARLMRGLEQLVTITGPWNGPALAERPGAGAAGGLGFGLLCFAGAQLEPGATWVLRRNGLDDALEGAAAVVVAEATFDATSLRGKLTGEVLARARAHGVRAAVVTPHARIRPEGLLVVSERGHWTPADLTTVTVRAVREVLKQPSR